MVLPTETDGVDIFVKYEDDYADGVISAGVEAAYVIDYSVDAYSKGGVQVAGAYECAGYFNINNTCRSMPDLKAKGSLTLLLMLITSMVLLTTFLLIKTEDSLVL